MLVLSQFSLSFLAYFSCQGRPQTTAQEFFSVPSGPTTPKKDRHNLPFQNSSPYSLFSILLLKPKRTTTIPQSDNLLRTAQLQKQALSTEGYNHNSPIRQSSPYRPVSRQALSTERYLHIPHIQQTSPYRPVSNQALSTERYRHNSHNQKSSPYRPVSKQALSTERYLHIPHIQQTSPYRTSTTTPERTTTTKKRPELHSFGPLTIISSSVRHRHRIDSGHHTQIFLHNYVPP